MADFMKGLLSDPMFNMGIGLLSQGYTTMPTTLGQNLSSGLLYAQRTQQAQQQAEDQKARIQAEQARAAQGPAMSNLGKMWSEYKSLPAGPEGDKARQAYENAFSGDRPFSLQEWEQFQKMSPDEQKRFLLLKRAAPMANLGGSQVVLDPTRPNLNAPMSERPNTLKPENQPANVARNVMAQKGAEHAASVQVGANKASQAFTIAKEKNASFNQVIDDLIDNVGPGTAGPVAVALAGVPGTPAHDFAQKLATIEAQVAFGSLQAMREASPTGGALGQVSQMELELLKAAISSLKQSQSPAQLKSNLTRVKELTNRIYGAHESAYKKDYGGKTAAERLREMEREMGL